MASDRARCRTSKTNSVKPRCARPGQKALGRSTMTMRHNLVRINQTIVTLVQDLNRDRQDITAAKA
jgi:hypothetical protein